MKAFMATVVTAGLLAWGASGFVAQSGNDLFQQALVKERTAGDLNAAIALYQTIVQKHGSDRALVARALVQMGGCYEKLGSDDSVKSYARVVREFGDQKESVATARTRLAALQPLAVAQAGPTTRRIWDSVNQGAYNVHAPSADGRYVSFSGEWDDLYVRDLREGTSHRLTTLSERTDTKESVAESLVSPDGRYVAYGWDGGPTFDLRILPLTSQPAEPRILHASDETNYMVPVGWTPDGKSLVTLRQLEDLAGQIVFVGIADGSLRVLKSFVWNQIGQVSLSHDGRFIAYSAPAGSGVPAHDIFLLASDGSRETVVVRSQAEDRQPVWSPDGSQVLFVSNRTGNASLWTVHVAGGRPTGLPELVRTDVGGRLLGMTRSGALYYVTGGPTSNIYTVDVDAKMSVKGAPIRATERFVNGNTEPKWSRDGQSLAYRRGSSIVIRSEKTGEERVVLTELLAAQLTGWFPDGRSVLVLSRDVEQNLTRFQRLDTRNGNAEVLLSVRSDRLGIRPGRRPDLSPDGRSIFYIDRSQVPGESLLMRFDIDTRRSVELLRARDKDDAEPTAVAVSPDSDQLAFVAAGWVSVMPAAGGEPRKVSRRAASVGGGLRPELAWTPDQRYLLIVAGEDNGRKLWRVPVDDGESEGTGLAGDVEFLTVDPGGRRITYRLEEHRPWELWALENFLPNPRGSK